VWAHGVFVVHPQELLAQELGAVAGQGQVARRMVAGLLKGLWPVRPQGSRAGAEAEGRGSADSSIGAHPQLHKREALAFSQKSVLTPSTCGLAPAARHSPTVMSLGPRPPEADDGPGLQQRHETHDSPAPRGQGATSALKLLLMLLTS